MPAVIWNAVGLIRSAVISQLTSTGRSTLSDRCHEYIDSLEFMIAVQRLYGAECRAALSSGLPHCGLPTAASCMGVTLSSLCVPGSRPLASILSRLWVRVPKDRNRGVQEAR